MNYVLAVSGGVDSVVLLDMLAKRNDGSKLIVAHFDHGIRDDSAADARFVGELAKRYGLEFVTKREELGKRASEELARERRYAFLRNIAEKDDARIVTAHHQDDLIETIALNLTRGTGWRGLAVFAGDVLRPLKTMRKQELIAYALQHQLEWVEDSTNSSDAYLRNRLRRKLTPLSPALRTELVRLWQRQFELKVEIDGEVAHVVAPDHTYSRYFFTHADDLSARELLRAVVLVTKQVSLLRPQCERGLLMIKTAKAGTTSELGGGVKLRFFRDRFVVD